jgi:hypothetical protein
VTEQVIAPFSDRKISHGDSFCFVKKTFVGNLITGYGKDLTSIPRLSYLAEIGSRLV